MSKNFISLTNLLAIKKLINLFVDVFVSMYFLRLSNDGVIPLGMFYILYATFVLPEITFDSVKALCDAVKAFDFSVGVERILCVNDRELNLINTTSDVETEWSYTTESKLNDWLDSINPALSKMSSF